MGSLSRGIKQQWDGENKLFSSFMHPHLNKKAEYRKDDRTMRHI